MSEKSWWGKITVAQISQFFFLCLRDVGDSLSLRAIALNVIKSERVYWIGATLIAVESDHSEKCAWKPQGKNKNWHEILLRSCTNVTWIFTKNSKCRNFVRIPRQTSMWCNFDKAILRKNCSTHELLVRFLKLFPKLKRGLLKWFRA